MHHTIVQAYKKQSNLIFLMTREEFISKVTFIS